MSDGHSTYPWMSERWRKSRAFLDMNLKEQGGYRNLIDTALLLGGVIPNDERLLSKACGDPLEWPDIKDKVLKWFKPTPDGLGLTNDTANEVLAELESYGLQEALRRTRQERHRERRQKRHKGVSRSVASASPPPTPPYGVVGGDSTGENPNGNGITDPNREPIDAYNEIFGTRIDYTAGNLSASERAFTYGYTMEQIRRVFLAVKNKETDAAAWCWNHKREFEYLIRPEHRQFRTGNLVAGRIDVILNELATGAKPTK